MNFKRFLEDQQEDILNLQPDTVLTVYHGTTYDHAYNFCTNGIDAKHVNHHRVYSNHTSGGKQLKFGIFVAPDEKTAFKFGNYVIQFKVQGKDLIHMFPAEMKKANDSWKKYYPNSFRPAVTHELLHNSIEPQALFIGLISPNAIEKVYKWVQGTGSVPMTREEFVQGGSQNKVSHFDPTEYKMSLYDFAKKIAERENSTPEEILDILRRIYKRSGYLTGIGNIPYSLLRRIEAQLRKEQDGI